MPAQSRRRVGSVRGQLTPDAASLQCTLRALDPALACFGPPGVELPAPMLPAGAPRRHRASRRVLQARRQSQSDGRVARPAQHGAARGGRGADLRRGGADTPPLRLLTASQAGRSAELRGGGSAAGASLRWSHSRSWQRQSCTPPPARPPAPYSSRRGALALAHGDSLGSVAQLGRLGNGTAAALAWALQGETQQISEASPETPLSLHSAMQVLAANVSDETHPLLQRSDRCCNAERMDDTRCCRPHAMLWQVP